MKLTKLNIQNFIGCRSVDVDLTTPITLFSGANGAGKSSLQEAVRMALIGESVRVGLKKDYGQIVTDDEKAGFAEVHTSADGVYSIVLPSGKGTCLSDSPALPFVLDAPRFASLDENERRAFLFSLMGLSASGATVKDRLIVRGCAEQRIEAIMPLLRAGFDAAHKEAQQRARDAKTEWRTITGETYGDKKAETWAAANAAFDAVALADLQQRLAATEAALSEANQRMGALQADHKRHAEAAQRLDELRQKAGLYARIADKLVRDEAELNQWEGKLAEAQAAVSGRKTGLVHDLAYALSDVMLFAVPQDKEQRAFMGRGSAALSDYETQHGKLVFSDGNPELAAKVPEYTKARDLLARAVENGKRDLAESDAAAKSLADLEAATGKAPSEAEIQAARKNLDDLKTERSQLAAKLSEAQDTERKHAQAATATAKAKAAHMDVVAWLQIADALAPDGIPGEMLAEALEPINDRLERSSEDAGWLHVHIEPNMSVWGAYPGLPPRPYALLSESEKWRADAMLAEAISHLSGLKMLSLDRMDCLDIPARGQLIGWLDELAFAGELDTALVFGTLKALPAGLPETMSSWWIKNGVVAQLKETA